MKIGRHQPKPKGFNYRTFYFSERDKKREDLFGHLHEADPAKRMDFKGKITRKRKENKYADKIFRIVLALIALGFIFYRIYHSDFDYSDGINRFLE